MHTAPSHAALHVFLVEDSTLVRNRIANALLAIPGVTIAGEAEDVSSALEGIRARPVNAAVVDLRLVDSNGLDLVAMLSTADPKIWTIVLTNHSGPAFRAACLAAGADYFFDKTTEFDAVREVLAALTRATPARGSTP